MPEIFSSNDERAPNERPVAQIAPCRLAVETALGRGFAPFFVAGPPQDKNSPLGGQQAARRSVGAIPFAGPPQDKNSPLGGQQAARRSVGAIPFATPQSAIRRVVIMIHGRLRNADVYFRLARQALDAAGAAGRGTMLIAPQFLAAADVAAHRLPPDTLHWDWTGWMGGDPALGPAPLGSFDVLDAILGELARREHFPALESVVIAGHSGGGQVAQRYAVVARGEAGLLSQGVALRYVIANPSSYVYFDERRPCVDGRFAPFDAARCPGFNDWKYGLERLPAYARQAACAQGLEAAYARRDVTVLLGSADCDPAHPALDVSCAARAQGAHRLERGLAYACYMQARHPEGLRHRTVVIDGVGHDGGGMFTSPQGVAALFGDEEGAAE